MLISKKGLCTMKVKIVQFGEGIDSSFTVIDAETEVPLFDVTPFNSLKDYTYTNLTEIFKAIITRWRLETECQVDPDAEHDGETEIFTVHYDDGTSESGTACGADTDLVIQPNKPFSALTASRKKEIKENENESRD